MKNIIISFIFAVVLLGSVGRAVAISFYGPDNLPRAHTTIEPSVASVAEKHPCLTYTNHLYEVCTAYVANASLAVLVPYYKYANSSSRALPGYVTYRLASRYSGSAYSLMKDRVANFGSGTNEVSIPQVRIISASSDLSTNKAVLVTEESWLVKNPSGKVLFQESNRRHTVTMQRVPSYLLHKWVVTDIR